LQLKSVSLNGKPWSDFNAAQETINLPAGAAAEFHVVAGYR
jgi:hypothetical protein